jgi:hypothetical protein
MKRLIMNTNGTMPSPADLIETLCHFMHLDDFGWVKDRLNTTGRDSVRNHNFRSKGEKNDGARTELRDDVRGTRFAQMMTGAGGNEDEEGEGEGDECNVGQEGSVGGSVGGGGGDGDGGGGDEGSVASKTSKGSKHGKKKEEDDQASKIAEALQRKINGLDAPKKDEEKKSVPGGRLRQKVQAHAMGNMKISAAQEQALLDYDMGLAKLLEKYSLKQTRLGGIDANCISGGAFLDLGRQKVGRIIVISIAIVNTSKHEVQIDVIARGFRSDDTRVTMLARSFAPGLKRDVQVQFTVLDPPGVAGILAHVDVHVVPVRGGPGEQPVIQSCPVFYRPYRNEPAMVEIPVCNINNMANLMQRYCPEKAPKSLATTFEKRGDWYQGHNWRDGPAVVLPDAVGVAHPPKTFAGSLSPTKLLVAMSAQTKRMTSKLPPVGSAPVQATQVVLPGCSRGLLRTYEVQEVDVDQN